MSTIINKDNKVYGFNQYTNEYYDLKTFETLDSKGNKIVEKKLEEVKSNEQITKPKEK